MTRIARTFLQSIWKVVNSTMELVGIAMILYGCWMVRVWQLDVEDDVCFDAPACPWFLYTFIGSGVTLCLITCLGHISADSSNGFCLSCYMVIVFLLLASETLVAADVLLNSNWEKDLPEDPIGRLHELKEFMESNFEFFKWIGMLIIFAQGFSVLLAMALRGLGPNNRSKYDSDDEEYLPDRLPFINHHSQPPPYVVCEPRFPTKTYAWNARICILSTYWLHMRYCSKPINIFHFILSLTLVRPANEESS